MEPQAVQLPPLQSAFLVLLAAQIPVLRRKRSVPWPVMAAVAAAVALVLAAASFWFRRAAAPATWVGEELGGPERALCPRSSPDGHLLAFIAELAGTWQVGVMKEASGDYKMLTVAADKGYVGSISWSPDGSRIYYDRKFFHYPLKPLDALVKLGFFRSCRIVASYLKARLAPIQPERSESTTSAISSSPMTGLPKIKKLSRTETGSRREALMSERSLVPGQ